MNTKQLLLITLLAVLLPLASLTSRVIAQNRYNVAKKVDFIDALSQIAALPAGSAAYVYISGYVDVGTMKNGDGYPMANTLRNIHFIGVDGEDGSKATLSMEMQLPVNNTESDGFSLHYENLKLRQTQGVWGNSKHLMNFKDANKHYIDTLEFINCELTELCRSLFRGDVSGAGEDYTGAGTLKVFRMENCSVHNGFRQYDAMPAIYMALPVGEITFKNNTFYDLTYLNSLVSFGNVSENAGRQPVKVVFENNTLCAFSRASLLNFGAGVTTDSEFHIKNNIILQPNWIDDMNGRQNDNKDIHGVEGVTWAKNNIEYECRSLTTEELQDRIAKGVELTDIQGGLVQLENNMLFGYKYQNMADMVDAGDIIPIGDDENEGTDFSFLSMEDVPFAWSDFADVKNDFFQINNANPAKTAGKNGAPLGDTNNYTDQVITPTNEEDPTIEDKNDIGDVNGDTAIDVADIASVIDYMTGSESVDMKAADVNHDGTVDVADIATIIDIMATSGVEPHTAGYYQIPSEYLNGWDEGVVSSNDYYFVSKSEGEGLGYVCYMNDKVNTTLGLAFYFDSEFNLTEVVSEKGVLHIDENFIYYVDTQGSLVSSDQLEDDSSRRFIRLAKAPSVFSQIVEAIPGLSNLVTLKDRIQTAKDFFAGDWENAIKGLTTDLAGSLIEKAIGGVSGTTIGLGIGKCFNILNNSRQQLDEASVTNLLGSSQVQITNVQRKDLYSYDITLSVTGLATRPSGGWLYRQVDVMTGVYIRERYSTVTHQYKTGQSNMVMINSDNTITVSLSINDPHQTYYVAPVLIPYNGSYPLTGCIRYGETKRLDVDIASVLSAKGVKCIYNGSYNGDLIGYDVEASINASIVSVNEFSSWGVELYAQTPYSDYLEIQVLTAPLAVGSCTLKYQDIMSEEYFDKTSNSFKLRAVPFAIRKIDNDKFEGKAYDFEIKAGDWTLCPDSNHPHWIDLGLPSGTQWRCCNEGASSPEGYGGYYTFGKVASAPTLYQINELLDYTRSVWTIRNGVSGCKFIGSNGESIFLPDAAGYALGGQLYYVGSAGYYWSSTRIDEYTAYEFSFTSGFAHWCDENFIIVGNSVRPVR